MRYLKMTKYFKEYCDFKQEPKMRNFNYLFLIFFNQKTQLNQQFPQVKLLQSKIFQLNIWKTLTNQKLQFSSV